MFTEAKDGGSGGDNWSYRSCKAPVKSSPPKNQHPVFLKAGCPSCRPTNTVKALKGIQYFILIELKLYSWFNKNSVIILLCSWPFRTVLGNGAAYLSVIIQCRNAASLCYNGITHSSSYLAYLLPKCSKELRSFQKLRGALNPQNKAMLKTNRKRSKLEIGSQ